MYYGSLEKNNNIQVEASFIIKYIINTYFINLPKINIWAYY